jgi:hypothetical protein
MATTTTNYGFDIPQSTDLVKDGATAIATLGQDIDTAMNTALGTKKAGMVLLNTTSFSGVSSQAVTSIFSSTYKNYKIILNITSVTSDCSIFIKMRSGATDSSASYTSNRAQVINGTVSGAYGSPETNGFFIFNPDTAVGSGYYNASIDLSNPFESLTTTAQVFSVGLNQTGSYFLNLGGTLHELSNSYDSLNVLTSAGNMTGSIRVYGYNQ